MLDTLQSSALVRALSGLFDDVSLLLRQEIQLAKTEIASAAAGHAKAAAFFAVSGVFGLITLLLLCQTIVFALIAAGLAAHWACLIVTGALALIALAAFLAGRSAMARSSLPHRTVNQISRDIAVVKETLS
jgi:hypothetical protein